jgi:hypothetical protein
MHKMRPETSYIRAINDATIMMYYKPVCDMICQLTIKGYCLRQIGRIKGLPTKATILRWLNDPRKISFKDDYRIAKEIQHYILCDDLMDLTNKGVNFRNLGREGGRISKLHLKRHAKPRNWIDAALEDCYRIKYPAAS